MKTRNPVPVSLLALPLVLLAAPTTLGTATAQNALGECGIAFDDPAAIDALPNDAQDTFALDTYREECVQHFVNVEPLTLGHFHLSWEDPAISCYGLIGPGSSWAAGRPSGPDCVPADYVNEPRFVNSHWQEHWIGVWMEDKNTHQPRPFDVTRIHVGAGYPIQLWFRTQDGTWWCWSNLDDGETWKVGKWVKDVMEVRIRGANTGLGPYAIRNLMIKE